MKDSLDTEALARLSDEYPLAERQIEPLPPHIDALTGYGCSPAMVALQSLHRLRLAVSAATAVPPPSAAQAAGRGVDLIGCPCGMRAGEPGCNRNIFLVPECTRETGRWPADRSRISRLSPEEDS